jgi:hypothetical protein
LDAAGLAKLALFNTTACSPLLLLPRCSIAGHLPISLQDGQYRFHARVAGTAGDSGSEAVASFQLDSIPPVVGITGDWQQRAVKCDAQYAVKPRLLQ